MHKSPRFSALLAALISLAFSAFVTAQDSTFEVKTKAGSTLQIVSQLTPLGINTIHSWELILTTADGTPVSGAEIAVVGGMPLHDHGLPTEPRVTAETSAGHSLMEGVRFHMQGQWQMDFSIRTQSGEDTALVEFEI